MLKVRIFSLVAAAAALTACSAYPRTEADFGNSVRHMVRAQTANPGPVDSAAPESGDGDRLNSVLEAYRGDVARGDSAPQPVSISFGSGLPSTQ